MIESGKTYIGVVEDNNDPDKLGRLKVRVVDVFDDIEVEDIPWATPWKDINGNSFNVPEKGKILLVVFDQGDKYKPEYISSEHYNLNLENKLKKLDGDNYKSMKSLIFDHKTQIYVNDDEGLKIDHKYNNINIVDGSINLNLKDNNTDLNLGDATADQQAILGNHWMDWFDKLVDSLLGKGGGPFIGNLMAPTIASPDLITVLLEYKALRDPKFLSHHVNIVDNSQVTTVKSEDRENDGQNGDNWNSTVKENNVTEKTNDEFSPEDGPKKEYDPDYVAPATDGSPDETPRENNNPPIDLTSTEDNDKVNKLVRFLQSKDYIIYDKPNVLNIVGMRNKDDGSVTNKFDDKIITFFRDSDNIWNYMEYSVTTTPGFKPRTKELPDRVAVLALGQYVDQYKLGLHRGRKDHKCLKYSKNVVHRNDLDGRYNYNADTEEGRFGINIHRSSGKGSSLNVFNWSEGSQVFKNINQFNQFIRLCEKQEPIKSTFTYTLCRRSEFDNFS